MLTITGWLFISRLAISWASANRPGATMCTRAPAVSWEIGLTDDDPTPLRGLAGGGDGAIEAPASSRVNVRILGLGIDVVGSSTSSIALIGR